VLPKNWPLLVMTVRTEVVDAEARSCARTRLLCCVLLLAVPLAVALAIALTS
jgi:hypothetical protein